MFVNVLILLFIVFVHIAEMFSIPCSVRSIICRVFFISSSGLIKSKWSVFVETFDDIALH